MLTAEGETKVEIVGWGPRRIAANVHEEVRRARESGEMQDR